MRLLIIGVVHPDIRLADQVPHITGPDTRVRKPFKTFQAYGIAALLYMLVAFALVGGFRLAEHRLLAEIEAALALGMTRSQLFIHVLIPSMLRRALPAYSNEVIFVLHATAIAFTATVPDILKIAADVNAARFSDPETCRTDYRANEPALQHCGSAA
ncbi:hypothetical protein [Pseudomonas sp. ZB1P45]|uniref:hypothetical protein n=1 Tax=Pseudomonas frigoris TaxID=3398356 RepID=UPI0039EFD4DD